ncbi:hypothetical protein [uncultured Microbulbifer sp.]|uniref:hypothetical protein n=1 Tax=uncultured Microbulbifer sp. TaxID=348147 RepID=UPI0026052354|nr:hypothetical protein [uncultured Microbulbifer sp.]
MRRNKQIGILLGLLCCMFASALALDAEAAKYKYHYYEGSYTDVPDLSSLAPKKIGMLDALSLSSKEVTQDYAYLFKTEVVLDSSEAYRFQIGLRGKARVTVSNYAHSIVVEGTDVNTLHDIFSSSYSSFPANLKLTIEYLDNVGNGDIKLVYSSYYGGHNQASMDNLAFHEDEFPGVKYQYFEYTPSQTLPDLDSLTPHTSGDLTTVEVPPGATADGFGIRYQGYLSITEAGNYQIVTNFEGYKTREVWASYQFNPVQSNNAAVSYTSSALPLGYGTHAFIIDLHKTSANPSIDIQVITPSGTKPLADLLLQGSTNPDPDPDPDPDPEADSDNDGVPDVDDDFPNDPNETTDSDNDGVGDNADVYPNDPYRTELESVTNISAKLSAGSVELSWTVVPASDTLVTTYNIFSGIPANGFINYRLLQNIDRGTPGYTDTSATPGSTYSYLIESVMADGTRAPTAPAIAVNIPANFPNISNLDGTSDQNGVSLSWSAANIVSGSQFVISRSLEGGAYETIATVASTESTYLDTVAPANASVDYQVFNAENLSDGNSGSTYQILSNIETVNVITTDTTPEPQSGVVDYKYYEGSFTPFPDFSSLVPLNIGKINNLDLTPAPDINSANYGITYSGTFHINEAGVYLIYTQVRHIDMRMTVTKNNVSDELFNLTGLDQNTTYNSGQGRYWTPGEYQFEIEMIAGRSNPTMSFSYEFDDGPSQPITNLLGLDSDEDGVIDALDAYPNDPDRTELEKLTNLIAQVADEAIVIDWTAVDIVTSNVDTIELLRREYGSGTYTTLTSLPATATEYTDSSVLNGKAYEYIAVNQTATGITSAQSDNSAVFIAYNSNSVDSFSAVQEPSGVRLNWNSSHNGEFVVLRGLTGGALNELTVTTDKTYFDNTVQSGSSYDYATQARLVFSNPITSAQVTVDGPSTARATIVMPNALVMSLTNMPEIGEGQYQILSGPNAAPSIVVEGSFENALGSVTVKAVLDTQEIAADVDGQNFTVTLPRPTEASAWQIIGSAVSGNIQQQAALTLELLWDDQSPSIVINGDNPLVTAEDLITVTGTVSDAQGVQSVVVSTDRHSGQSFNVFVDQDGSFSASVPIEFDENRVKVSATDSVDNTDYKVLVVQRANINRPVISISSHINGQLVNVDRASLTGELTTALSLGETSLYINGQPIALTEQAQGRYSFVLADVSLVEGNNKFNFVASAGGEQSELAFTLRYEKDGVLSPPVLESLTPTPGATISSDSFMVAGAVSADYPLTNVSVNGQPVPIYEGATYVNFSDLINFSGQSSVDVVIEAQSLTGQSLIESNTYYFDDQAPVIETSLTEGVIWNVFDNPYELAGVVTDTNFSTLTVNGQVVDVYPGEQENQFIFQAILNLSTQNPGDLTPIEVKAFDQAGNISVKNYLLKPLRDTEIDIIAPRINSEFLVDDTRYDLQILARVKNLPDDPYVFGRVRKVSEMSQDEITQPVVTILWNDVTTMTLHDNGVVTGEITIPADSASYVLQLFVSSGFQSIDSISFANRGFVVENRYTAPLELLRTEPVNLATGIEPNEPVVLYFNKGFNPEKMTVTVTETAHGKTYVNNDPLGTNFLMAKGSVLEEIHRQQSIVPGGLSQLPGDNIYAFYPERDFAYDGQVQVEVKYRGVDIYGEDEEEKINQFRFQIRPLPTMIEGVVVDQFGQSVENVKVSIDQLDRDTFTDNEGAFSFGYGDNATNTIKGGLYRLSINPNLTNPRFGEISKQVNVANGELNSAGVIKLAVLNKAMPFQNLASGSSAVLANGELTMDLTNTSLRFPNGAEEGGVHVNMLRAQDLTMRAISGLQPNWAFGLQPQGITINGKLGLSIKAPSLNGSYDYLPEDGKLVLLMAKDRDQDMMIPVGVGQINNKTIESLAPINVPVLDYLAYVLVPDSAQEMLQRYADGEISYTVLVTLLQTDNSQSGTVTQEPGQ